jgi:predicted flap endonuclease-1-like 5' DNA nuclease
MSSGNPTNIVIIALLGIAALLFLIASFGGRGKWRRMYEEEAEEHAAYADRADDELRAARQRIAELEGELSALERRHAEAQATIARAETVVAPVVIATPVEAVVAAAPDPQPIIGERATITELPPAPIMGVTPLRAAPVEAEFTPVPDTVAEADPVVVEAEPAAVETAPVVVEEQPAVVEAPSAPVEVVEEPGKAWFGASKRDDLTRLRGLDPVMNTRLFGLGVTSFDDVVHLSQEDEMALEQRLGVAAGYITREQWREQASLLRFGKESEFNERFGTANV